MFHQDINKTHRQIYGDCGMDVVPLEAHHGAGSWPPMAYPGEGCER